MENVRLNYLYILLEEEKRIIHALPKSKGEYTKELKSRLLEISAQKKAYSKYEVECIALLLNPVIDTDILKSKISNYNDNEKQRKRKCEHIAQVTKKPLRYENNSFNLFVFILMIVIKNSIKAQNGGNIAFELALIKMLFEDDKPAKKWDM